MEEMEELIEESLRESPSPPPVLRPPSPKLLRSRTSLLLAATEPTKTTTTSTVASATEPELNPALMNLDLEAAFSYQVKKKSIGAKLTSTICLPSVVDSYVLTVSSLSAYRLSPGLGDLKWDRRDR